MSMDITDKAVIVTGGASGMGRASALLFAAKGAKVAVADRDAGGARKVSAEIVARGGAAIDVAVDVGSSASVARLIERTHKTFGRIDVLLHCAAICPRKPILEMADDDWREVMRVNLDGTFYVARDVGRVMAAQKSGTMILVTSDRGVHGSIDYAHYAASKGGMIALTKSLALSLGRYGVTVNGLNPGITDTPLARAAVTQWEEKKQLDVLNAYSLPEEIAEMALFLAGTAGTFMTGQILGTRMRYGA
jgi:NAD(P)-dependent dehydrogenase (short-subunit alcohol dehydrogenase family)